MCCCWGRGMRNERPCKNKLKKFSMRPSYFLPKHKMNLNIVCLSLNFFLWFVSPLTQSQSQMIKLCLRVKSMAKQVQKVEVFFFSNSDSYYISYYTCIAMLTCLYSSQILKARSMRNHWEVHLFWRGLYFYIQATIKYIPSSSYVSIHTYPYPCITYWGFKACD